MNDESKGHNDALPADLQAEADALLAESNVESVQSTPDQEQRPEDVPTGEIIASFMEITFNGLIAPRRGLHWEMKRDECQAVGNAYGAVIDKYFPDLNVGVEFTAIIVTISVFGPRVAADARLRAEQEPTDAGDKVPADE